MIVVADHVHQAVASVLVLVEWRAPLVDCVAMVVAFGDPGEFQKH